MRALNYAKVIKLPSHSILATHTQSEDIKQEWRNGVPTSRNREEACRTVVPLAPFPLLSLLLLYPRSAFVLQHIWEDERINSEDAGSLWMSIVESSFVFLVAGIKQWQGQSLFVCMLPFFFLALCVLLCFFFFGFFLSWFFFSFLGWFFFSPFLPMYYFFLWVFALVLLLFFFFALWFLVLYSRSASPFYRDSSATSFNQSCFCRTVIFHERDHRWETWSTIGSNPLQIFIGMEKTNMAVPPALATFRQQWTFSFWPLIFGILTVGSQLIKNSFQFCHLD